MTCRPVLLAVLVCLAALAFSGCGPEAASTAEAPRPAPAQAAEQEPEPPPATAPSPGADTPDPAARPEAIDEPLDIPKVSYTLGKQTGGFISELGLELDRDVLTQSWQELVDGKSPGLTEEEQKELKVYLNEKGRERAARAARPEGESPSAPEEVVHISRAFGKQVGDYMLRAGVEIDRPMFTKGWQDVLDGNDPMLSKEEMAKHGRAFQQKAMERFREFRRKKAEDNKAAAEAFLEENAAKEGVVVLESGLQYKVLQEGAGASPAATDNVKVHSRGRLLSGTEFDSSYKRNQPAQFTVNRGIKGRTEALQLMKEGDKWELYIPPDLAHGLLGKPPIIGPNELLILEVELIEVLPPEPGPEPAAPKDASSETETP